MVRTLGGKRGQSMIEYLVIAAVVIAAILAISATVRTQADSVMTSSAGAVGKASTAVKLLDSQPH